MANSRLAAAAEELARDSTRMDSYNELGRGSGYYLTENKKLGGALGKPDEFPGKAEHFIEYWKKLGHSQRIYLLDLAGLDAGKISLDSYQKMKNAYNKWKKEYYAVFLNQSNWPSCNLFVGEALYMIDKNYLNSEKKYFSAREIRENKHPKLKLITDLKSVERGDIASMHSGGHVEIVTKVRPDSGFYARGAGSGNGAERYSGSVNDSTNKFYRVE